MAAPPSADAREAPAGVDCFLQHTCLALVWVCWGALPCCCWALLALAEAGTAPGWQGLLADRQLPGALALSLRSALTSTGLALVLTVLIVTAWQGSVRWQRLAALLPALLAVPHAAFAIGLAWLIAPAGWLARALAMLTGWTEPPQWQSVNAPPAWR
jgi:putative thiamine transport system permease protein